MEYSKTELSIFSLYMVTLNNALDYRLTDYYPTNGLPDYRIIELID